MFLVRLLQTLFIVNRRIILKVINGALIILVFNANKKEGVLFVSLFLDKLVYSRLRRASLKSFKNLTIPPLEFGQNFVLDTTPKALF